MTDEIKTCRKCGQDKPIGQYYKNCRMVGGVLNHCKRCQDEANRKIRKTERGATVQLAANQRSVARNSTPLYRELQELNDQAGREALAILGLTLTRIPSLSELSRKSLPKGVLVRL